MPRPKKIVSVDFDNWGRRGIRNEMLRGCAFSVGIIEIMKSRKKIVVGGDVFEDFTDFYKQNQEECECCRLLYERFVKYQQEKLDSQNE